MGLSPDLTINNHFASITYSQRHSSRPSRSTWRRSARSGPSNECVTQTSAPFASAMTRRSPYSGRSSERKTKARCEERAIATSLTSLGLSEVCHPVPRVPRTASKRLGAKQLRMSTRSMIHPNRHSFLAHHHSLSRSRKRLVTIRIRTSCMLIWLTTEKASRPITVRMCGRPSTRRTVCSSGSSSLR